MDSLYCYKFNDITGEIIKLEIPEYRKTVNQWSGKATYSWGKPRINKSDTHFSVPEEKLDRFVSSKVFTFHNDDEYAYRIIENSLKHDINELEKQIARKQSLLDIYYKGQKRRIGFD